VETRRLAEADCATLARRCSGVEKPLKCQRTGANLRAWWRLTNHAESWIKPFDCIRTSWFVFNCHGYEGARNDWIGSNPGRRVERERMPPRCPTACPADAGDGQSPRD